jgi:hypothetical protein
MARAGPGVRMPPLPRASGYQLAGVVIRETVETVGAPGILPSQDAALTLYGPEPVHEATAIVDALRQLLAN